MISEIGNLIEDVKTDKRYMQDNFDKVINSMQDINSSLEELENWFLEWFKAV